MISGGGDCSRELLPRERMDWWVISVGMCFGSMVSNDDSIIVWKRLLGVVVYGVVVW